MPFHGNEAGTQSGDSLSGPVGFCRPSLSTEIENEECERVFAKAIAVENFEVSTCDHQRVCLRPDRQELETELVVLNNDEFIKRQRRSVPRRSHLVRRHSTVTHCDDVSVTQTNCGPPPMSIEPAWR